MDRERAGARQGRIAGFVDPAIYCGSPEIELAFATLFGTFGESFFEAYEELMPLEPGFHELRSSLYNLYPRLVHVRLFGAGYLAGDRRDAGAACASSGKSRQIGTNLANGRVNLGKKEPARTAPGRSSLRNEPSSKGMAFNSGLARPPILFLSLRFRACVRSL